MGETISIDGGMHFPAEAFDYLAIQRGGINHLKGNRALFLTEYVSMLASEYASVFSYLPKTCESILDVGSGLGGIDILLADHYQMKPAVTLLDGVDDDPVVTLHRKTFNDMRVAGEFLMLNGIKRFDYVDPEKMNVSLHAPFDLVISLCSWCFHYEPGKYLAYVRKHCRPGATLLIDVRVAKGEWLAQMCREFDHIDEVHRSFKFATHCFKVKS